MTEIIINGGKVFLDDDDFEVFSSKIWRIREDGYVACGKVLLHRLLCGLRPSDGLQVDHRNGNRSDCRRKNLRVCTRSQNQANRAVSPACKSGLKGVTFYKGKWQAKICHHGRDIYLGRFGSKEDASEFYQLAASMLFGEFAYHERDPWLSRRKSSG